MQLDPTGIGELTFRIFQEYQSRVPTLLAPKMSFKVVLTVAVLGFILVTGEDGGGSLEEAKKVAKMAKNFHETVGGNNSESHGWH